MFKWEGRTSKESIDKASSNLGGIYDDMLRMVSWECETMTKIQVTFFFPKMVVINNFISLAGLISLYFLI
jgi:hypothetical protein